MSRSPRSFIIKNNIAIYNKNHLIDKYRNMLTSGKLRIDEVVLSMIYYKHTRLLDEGRSLNKKGTSVVFEYKENRLLLLFNRKIQ